MCADNPRRGERGADKGNGRKKRAAATGTAYRPLAAALRPAGPSEDGPSERGRGRGGGEGSAQGPAASGPGPPPPCAPPRPAPRASAPGLRGRNRPQRPARRRRAGPPPGPGRAVPGARASPAETPEAAPRVPAGPAHSPPTLFGRNRDLKIYVFLLISERERETAVMMTPHTARSPEPGTRPDQNGTGTLRSTRPSSTHRVALARASAASLISFGKIARKA